MMKKELQMRLAVASFMQETLQEIANKKVQGGGDNKEVVAGAQEVINYDNLIDL